MIYNFNNFLERKIFIPAKTDSPTVSATMNQVNKLSDDIEEFNKKKVEINNIYATYIDERDLINKLSARKYCDKVDAKSKIKFHNELIGFWAQAADKRRQLDDLKKQIEKIKGTIDDDTKNAKSGATPEDLFNQNLELNQSKIKSYEEKIRDMEMEIVAIEKKCKDQLKEKMKNLNFQKTRIDKYRLDKFSQFKSEE